MAKSLDGFIPPPIKGVNYNQIMTAGPSEYALQLDILIPRREGLVMPYDVGETLASPVGETLKTLFSYGGTQLFAASDNGIYGIPTGSAPGIAVNEGRGWAVEMATAAGKYGIFFNGTDFPAIYDGTSWAFAAWTGPTLGDLFQGVVYRRRLFLADKTSLRFWYLSPDAVAGAATAFNLGTVFSRGGNLIAMATMSLDGGLGPDDLLLAYTSNGELAVFSGNDPGATSSWSIIGVYDVGMAASGVTPQPKCMTKLGGDVYVFTANGIFSVSAVMRGKDVTVTPSISANIDPYLVPSVQFMLNPNMHLSLLRSQKLLVVHQSRNSSSNGDTYAMDLNTGGWTRWPVVSNDSLGLFWDYTEINDLQLLKVYALTGATGEVKRVFWEPGKVLTTFSDSNNWAIRTPYMRLGTLSQSQLLHVRPYLWLKNALADSSVYSYEAGAAFDLSDDYTMKSVGGSTVAEAGWGTGGNFKTFGTPAAASMVSRPWSTLQAGYSAESTSLYLRGTFVAGSTRQPSDFRFLGCDYRAGSLGMAGP